MMKKEAEEEESQQSLPFLLPRQEQEQEQERNQEQEQEEVKKTVNNFVLPGYEAGPEICGINHSKTKLQTAAIALKSYFPHSQQDVEIQSRPVTTISESWSYRCRSSFQILKIKIKTNNNDNDTCKEKNQGQEERYRYQYQYQYAMRTQGNPIPLGIDYFPIATLRIQKAMKDLMEMILNNNNYNNDTTNKNATTTTTTDFSEIKRNLASVTFSSSWIDNIDNENDERYNDEGDSTTITTTTITTNRPLSDCIVTLNYDQPLNNEEEWKKQAKIVGNMLHLRQINGRSKKCLLYGLGNGEQTIRDTIYIYKDTTTTTTTTDGDNGAIKQQQQQQTWITSLSIPKINNNNNNNNNVLPEQHHEQQQQQQQKDDRIIKVSYEKPETAFYHPNANAMMHALKWMLDCISDITSKNQTEYSNNNSISTSSSTSSGSGSGNGSPTMNLLEMYCGCGAHTVALAKSGMLNSILAVELDSRLVEACEKNISINGLQDIVTAVQSDAGKWAKEHKKRPKQEYSILLVDPPRSGLDDEVCGMARKGTFQHFLYISCGHKALLRDLKRLSPLYEVVNCMQLDLFPRTDSIETLVYLKRVTTSNSE